MERVVGHLSHGPAQRHTYIVVRGIIAAHIVAAQRCLREQLFYLLKCKSVLKLEIRVHSRQIRVRIPCTR